MAGKLSTHVLDTATGRPAAGVKIRLYGAGQLLVEAETNSDGRTDQPLIAETSLVAGDYRIEFEVGEYFARQQHVDARRFLNVVPIAFTVDDATRGYHVPLLVSPWAYSTYRGS